MRCLILLACLCGSPAVISAEELPQPQVEDPFGLGERLALVDHLREVCKLNPSPDATMDQLVAMYWKFHRKDAEAIHDNANEQALAADRMRRMRNELKERFQIDAPADADEATLGHLLNDARTKATGDAVQKVLDKAAARDNPTTQEEAARYAQQDQEAARLRQSRIDQDEKSTRAEIARIDDQRLQVAKQGKALQAEQQKLRDAYNAAVSAHNQLVSQYDQKTKAGSPDARKILDQVNAQKQVIAQAKAAEDAKAAEVTEVAKQDEALVAKRKNLEESLSNFDQRRAEEQRRAGDARPPSGPATPGGIAQAPPAGSQQAYLVAGVMLLVVKESGTGTGFIVSRDGLIVTNAHVVKSPKANVMAMWDASAKRPPVRVRVIDFAEKDDLALLKAESGAPYEPMRMQEVYDLQRPLISAGFPLAGSVAETLQTSPSDIVLSRGILGSVRRNGDRVEWLQHDCRVASGNSGGPVLDQQSGAVIGVTTMVLSTDGVHSHGDGINLAIPIRKVMDRFSAYLKP